MREQEIKVNGTGLTVDCFYHFDSFRLLVAGSYCCYGVYCTAVVSGRIDNGAPIGWVNQHGRPSSRILRGIREESSLYGTSLRLA
jgi:hypothetical protein